MTGIDGRINSQTQPAGRASVPVDSKDGAAEAAAFSPEDGKSFGAVLARVAEQGAPVEEDVRRQPAMTAKPILSREARPFVDLVSPEEGSEGSRQSGETVPRQDDVPAGPDHSAGDVESRAIAQDDRPAASLPLAGHAAIAPPAGTPAPSGPIRQGFAERVAIPPRPSVPTGVAASEKADLSGSSHECAGAAPRAAETGPLRPVNQHDPTSSADGTIQITLAVLDDETHLPPAAALAPVDQIAARVAAEAGLPDSVPRNEAPSSSDKAALLERPVPRLPQAVGSVTKILNVRLEPASLGPVTIRMRLSGSSLGLEVEAEVSGTVRLLVEGGELLAEKLQAAGYSIDKLIIKSASRPVAASGDGGALGGERSSKAEVPDWDRASPASWQDENHTGHGRRQHKDLTPPPAEPARDPPAAVDGRLSRDARFV